MAITLAGSGGSFTFHCQDLIATGAAGRLARERWRQRYVDTTKRTYGWMPAGLDLTGILAFYGDVLATPAVLAALAGPWVLDVSAPMVSFSLARDWAFPTQVALARGDFQIESDRSRRLAAARRRYLDHAHMFAAMLAPQAPMSSRQRAGIVHDAWELALVRAQGRSSAQVARQACCLIYALPGAHECAGCPRLRGNSQPTVP